MPLKFIEDNTESTNAHSNNVAVNKTDKTDIDATNLDDSILMKVEEIAVVPKSMDTVEKSRQLRTGSENWDALGLRNRPYFIENSD